MVTQAKVISLHWEEKATAIQEATLEVEHPNGERQLFVIPILRMTDRLTGEMHAQRKENPPHGPVSERFMRHHYGAKR
jgi:hypothetical protein